MEKGFTINVLDKGFVRYIDHMGSDERIVEAARISYKSPSKGADQDKKLLKYLYRHQHTSPFEQCNITFNIKMPIFVMRQFVRQRTFRLNEWSARYSEMKDDFYIPIEWRQQDNKNKQSSIEVDGKWNPIIELNIDNDPLTSSIKIDASSALSYTCDECFKLYKKFIEAGIAKEMARMVLPVNLYTEIYVNCDLNNLLKFLRLRLDSHAQYEIREVAKGMYQIAKELYPVAIEAFDTIKYKVEEIDE